MAGSTVPSWDQYGGHASHEASLCWETSCEAHADAGVGKHDRHYAASPHSAVSYDLISAICWPQSGIPLLTHWQTGSRIQGSPHHHASEGRDHTSTIMLSNHGSTCHLLICVQIFRVYGSISDTQCCISQAVIHSGSGSACKHNMFMLCLWTIMLQILVPIVSTFHHSCYIS